MWTQHVNTLKYAGPFPPLLVVLKQIKVKDKTEEITKCHSFLIASFLCIHVRYYLEYWLYFSFVFSCMYSFIIEGVYSRYSGLKNASLPWVITLHFMAVLKIFLLGAPKEVISGNFVFM